MATPKLVNQAAEIEQLQGHLHEAQGIIRLIPDNAYHAPHCRAREPGFLFECDCGLSDLLQSVQSWLEAQAR